MNLIIKILFSQFIICIISCSNNIDKQNQIDNNKSPKENISTNKPKTKTKNILCFGNSLTAGFGLEESQAWPSLLQNKIDSLEKDYLVINAGLSGETTSNGVNRINWVLKQPVDIFILELGANDMLRGLDVQKTRENLDKIIVKVRDKYPNIPIIIAGMLAPPNMGKDYQTSFDSIFEDLSKKHKTTLIPFFLQGVATIKDLNLPDGKHPNEKGQKVVLETVWKALKPIL